MRLSQSIQSCTAGMAGRRCYCNDNLANPRLLPVALSIVWVALQSRSAGVRKGR